MSMKRFGKVVDSLTYNAHHPGIFFGAIMMENAQDKARLVSQKLKAVAGIRAATLIGCPF